MPPRTSHDAVVAAVVGDLLHNGDASLLYQALVKGKQVALSTSGGMNWPLGNPFEYNGPTLMTSLIVYPPTVTEDQLLADYDAAIDQLKTQGPSGADMERIKAKMQSDWYSQLEIPLQRASVLAHATLFDGDPERVNQIPSELSRVTAEEVKAFAAKYLVNTNRTIINRVPSAAAKPAGAGKGAQ
jgi:zinc protease